MNKHDELKLAFLTSREGAQSNIFWSHAIDAWLTCLPSRFLRCSGAEPA
jgi:hypothetical protein